MNPTAFFEQSSPLLAAFVASLLGGALATTLGAVPVLWMGRLSQRSSNAMLSFAAGVMLAATVFSLLLPGLELAETMFEHRLSAVLAVVAALLFGGLSMGFVNRILPHEHFLKGPEGPSGERIARVWLFVLAITLHNFPEGLSIGVASASGDARIGLGVTIGIGLQNLPEGLAVAMALAALGYPRLYALRIAALTGIVELFGGMFGAGLLVLSTAILPLALAFAAGTMLFVISDEVIPETHRGAFGETATASLFVGFDLMFVLDVALR
ncbi:MAG: ZIP family metal transporter [Burkholderiaceae bacterium]|nr:ZIP family metal transporter [Burkholderiaceae bacterium]